MKKLVLLVLLANVIAFLEYDKKDSVALKGPLGKTVSVTY